VKSVPTIPRNRIVSQRGGEHRHLTLVAEVVQQNEARPTDARIAMFQRTSAQQVEVNHSARAKGFEVAAEGSDVAAHEFFDLPGVALLEHRPKLTALRLQQPFYFDTGGTCRYTIATAAYGVACDRRRDTQ
jgi:hypothetical protein